MVDAAITAREFFRLAVVAYKAGKLSEAEQICQKIIAAEPDLLPARRLLAAVQLAFGRPRDALASCELILAAAPNDATALRGSIGEL